MSPLLFSLVFDRLENWVKGHLTKGSRDGGVQILLFMLLLLLFADDLILLGYTRDYVVELFESF